MDQDTNAAVCHLEDDTFKCLAKGILSPMWKLEGWYNQFTRWILYVSAAITGILAFPICIDIIARNFLGLALEGIVEIETLALVPMAFFAAGFVTVSRQHIQIDLFFEMFSPKTRVRLVFLANLLCLLAAILLVWQTFEAAMENTELTPSFFWPVRNFILCTTIGFALAAIGFFFQVIHVLDDMIRTKDFAGILLVIALISLLIALPFIYKSSDIRLSGLVLGALWFAVLMTLLLLRVPIAFTMAAIGTLGLICLKRTPWIALSTIGEIPFLHTADFVFVAIPMFMLMGELAFYSGISADLFECANRWLGRLPGGLAVGTVGGCAGFSAICGESLPTIITMTSVALPPMRERNYDPALATGVLAAGGTLGILVPPSIGFIFYSIITEESIGKLFIAGMLPALLMIFLFIMVVVIQVKLKPSLAPRGDKYTWGEKFSSLVFLLPMFALFGLVIGGILTGTFTPGEGGAVGAMGAFIYALSRRKITWQVIKDSLIATVIMSSKIFLIFAGVYIFGAFLASSRLPNLLAETIVALDISRYGILMVIVVVLILLGCVMNVLPMMLLTLPSLYPTIQALGFDGVWFGVIAVMLMEMGIITPPVGMGVFALSSMAPDIPMATIFRGVLPFVLAMFTCIMLIIIFPGIALWLPSVLLQ